MEKLSFRSSGPFTLSTVATAKKSNIRDKSNTIMKRAFFISAKFLVLAQGSIL